MDQFNLSDTHTLVQVNVIADSAEEIEQDSKNSTSSLEEFDKSPSLGPYQIPSILRIQKQIMKNLETLDRLTKDFLLLSEIEFMDRNAGENTAQVEASSDEEEGDEDDIQMKGLDDEVEILLPKDRDKYGMSKGIQDELGRRRKEMSMRYSDLAKSLKMCEEELKLVEEENKELYAELAALNSRPVYECTVKVSAKEPLDGCPTFVAAESKSKNAVKKKRCDCDQNKCKKCKK